MLVDLGHLLVGDYDIIAEHRITVKDTLRIYLLCTPPNHSMMS